jgi:release factor glutamine methyltransferase
LLPRAAFAVCDYAAALAGPLDLIVSNPPYIRSDEIAMLDAEVRDHDPRDALDGGADGLDAYRRLAPRAAGLLAPGGWLVVEVGHDQANAVEGLLAAAGLRPAGVRRDLAGICRIVKATWFPG